MPARPANWTPSLGLNLAANVDWSGDFPFLDRMLTHRPWVTSTDTQWNTGAPVPLDANNWPTSIPDGTVLTTVLSADPHGANPTGRYVVTWEGTGEVAVTLTAAMVEGDGTGGHAVIIAPGTPGEDYNPLFLQIRASDPADPIRNIHVVREDQQALLDAGEVFSPRFLEMVQDFRSFRFMDFGLTNNSTIAGWEGRPEPTDASWAWDGVPMEAMVELANRTGADPWFCMPHLADDEYVRRFAEYVRDNLDPRLVAHVEFSNEAWNWQFQQSQDALRLADERWAVDANGNGTIDPEEHIGDGWMQWNGMRAAQVAQIWTEVFGAEADQRLDRVIATQTAWLGLEDPLLNAPLWVAEGNAAPWTFFDSYAITGYFNGSLYEPANLATVIEWAGMGAAGLDLAFQQLRYADLLPDSWGLEDSSFLYNYHAQVANAHGLRLVAYEAGQHLVSTSAPQLTDFFTALVNDPRMGELYTRNVELFREAGGALWELFSSFGGASIFGHWGNLDTVYEDSSARWDAIQAYNNANPAWWEARDPLAFANGRIMLGTAAAQFSSGSAGGDRILGGAGNDTIAGRQGSDTVLGGDDQDVINGHDGADQLHGDAGHDRLYGGADRDSLWGGAGNDRLDGGTGDDRLHGDDGADNMSGGMGGDTLDGGTGNDWLNGQDGADALDGAAGADNLLGGTGADTLRGGEGNDFLNGQDDADSLQGEAGIDRLYGSAGADSLSGGAGNDRLDGGDGNDLLEGDAGTDNLAGGAGADTLRGGGDMDRLAGGAGNDVFVFDQVADSSYASPSLRDRISDFTPGQDRILLALDANDLVAGIQDFVLVTGAFAANRPGDVRIVAAGASSWVLYGNTDADAQAEFAVVIQGGAPLLADLIL